MKFQNVYEEGWNAFHRGLEQSLNPYNKDTVRHDMWLIGWHDAKDDLIERLTFRYPKGFSETKSVDELKLLASTLESRALRLGTNDFDDRLEKENLYNDARLIKLWISHFK